MALGLVRKAKQQIEWTGESRAELSEEDEKELEELKTGIREIRESIRGKRKILDGEELQYARTKTLLDRNRALVRRQSKKRRSSIPDRSQQKRIHFPFLLVQAPEHTSIRCQVSTDCTAHQIDFDNEFQIFNDYDVLCLMAETPMTPKI